jgi:hypothetical protein
MPTPTLSVLFLLGALVAAPAQSNSVTTTWDCLISGKRKGIAHLSFYGNGTVSGYEILVPQRLAAPHTVLVNDSLGSDGLGVRPEAPADATNIYGAFPINGSWGFDRQGRIVGNYLEVVPGSSCTTNQIPLSTNAYEWPTPVYATNLFANTFCVTYPIATNPLTGMFTNQTICYSNEVDCPGAFTNTVNFNGKVVPLKRLTLTCKTSLGTVTLRGVPAVNLTSLNGAWSGVKKQNQTAAYEFLSLTNLVDEPNTYEVRGSGAGYNYLGVAALSSQRKIALALTVSSLDGSYQSTRAVIGPFDFRKLSANTTGLDSPGGMSGLTNRVNFQVTKRLVQP